MKNILLIISLFIMGCGQARLKDQAYHDPEVIYYVNFFNRYANRKLDNVTIILEDLKDNLVGTARKNPQTGDIEITLDSLLWPTLSVSQKEQLFLHEAGHAVYGLLHDDNTTVNDFGKIIPKSLMQSKMIQKNVYNENREYYLKQFFDIIHSIDNNKEE